MPSKDRLYAVYRAMRQRCLCTKHPSYKFYSKNGITVCGEWMGEDGFANFKKWALENGYDYSKDRKEQSLDRVDNLKGYSPDNCRWVSHSQNCKNTSRNVELTYDGKTMVITDWAKEVGLSVGAIRNRMKKTDNVEEILFSEKLSFHKSNTGIRGISKIKGRE